MKKYKYLYKPIRCILCALALSGCVRDEIDTPFVPGEQTADVSISVRVPGIPLSNPTRALNTAGENNIDNIVVLAFDGNEFKYFADTYKVDDTSDDQIKTFNVKLKLGQYDLWILANCKSIFDAYNIPSNATKETFREELLLQITGKWNTASTGFTPLPMWGEKSGVNVTPELSIKGNDRILLIRSVAKVDITIDRSTVPAADFTLQGVNFYHWSNQGQLIPDATAFGGDPAVVQQISGNTGSSTAAQAQSYTGAERDDDGFFTNVIYVPETPAGTDGALTGNPCLLINGTYQSTAGWYKAEFLDTDVSNGIDRYLPLLRNYHYNVVITGVSARGFATADEAYRSKAQNLIVRIHEHIDPSLTNVMYDGQYWLAWDPEKIELDKEVHSATDTDNIIEIETNCEDGWKFERVTDASDNPVTWLSVPTGEQSAAKNTRGRVHLVTTENTGATRTAYVHFSAGRMDMSFEVTQSDQTNLRVRLLDSNGQEVSGTVWLKTPQGREILKEYKLEWLPKEADCVVTATRTGDNDLLYESGRGITAGTLQNDNGEHFYALNLQNLDEQRDYYGNNNLLRTYGNQYTFTVTSHGQTASTTLNLRHHLDMISTDIDALGYRQGYEHTYNFFASTSYRVTSVSDPQTVQYNNEIGNLNRTVQIGETVSDTYKFRLRNPNKEKDEAKIGINLTFDNSDLPDTTMYIQANYTHANSYMSPPGGTVHIPIRQALRNWRHAWLRENPLPNLSNMSAHLVWETANGLISSVQIVPILHPVPDPRMAEIEVQIGTGNIGNALICLEADNKVVWSWHIWVTNYVPGSSGNPAGSPTGIFRHTDSDNSTITYELMDRNLGALGYQPSDWQNGNTGGILSIRS